MPSVLVTGANRGIGLAITRHLSARGWDVYATARSDSALAELGTMPGVHPTRLDITDRASLDALSAQLPAQLDGVVNNAGIIVNGPVEGLTLDDLSRQWTALSCELGRPVCRCAAPPEVVCADGACAF